MIKIKTGKRKSEKSRFNKTMAFSEMFLLIVATFAFAFVMNAGVVSGDGAESSEPVATTPPVAPAPTKGSDNPEAEEGAPKSEGGGGGNNTISRMREIGGKMKEGLKEGFEYIGWATAATQILGRVGGMKDDEVNSLNAALAAGGLAYALTSKLISAWISVPVSILLAALVYSLIYSETQTKTLEYKCMPWQAPNGGAKCEQCNKDALKPCTEYRCKSLGQSCGIINAGTLLEKCINLNPKDTTSPGIDAWKEVLTPGNEYKDVKARPPGKGGAPSGMKITKTGGGCINSFSIIDFGIKTTEPAQCKIDYKHTGNFEEMSYYLGGNNLYITNHSDRLNMPNTDTLKKLYPDVANNGEYSMYIRCKDGNGNENRDEFVIQFCVDQGPDINVPQIVATNPTNGKAIQYRADNVSVSVYLNEPSACKWDRKDTDYKVMMNNMTCTDKIWEMNAQSLYTCQTTLTAVEDRKENTFYFACADLVDNKMKQNYVYKLMGSQPLDIVKTLPNGTTGGSTNTILTELEVRTDNGYDNGKARCFYSETGAEGSYVSEMFETGGSIHKQSLDLSSGKYTYYFMCVDEGGNTAFSKAEFSVLIDKTLPKVVRAYNENDKLKIILDEKGSCAYSTDSCNFGFDEGNPMVSVGEGKIHYAEWEFSKSFYIKCKDDYSNQPDSSMCSIIVKPYTLN